MIHEIKPPQTRRWLPHSYAWVLAALLAAPCTATADDDPPVPREAPAATASITTADYLPEDIEVVITLRTGDRLLDAFHSTLESRGFFDSRAFGMLSRDPGFLQAQVALRGVATTAGLDAWSAIATVLGRETAVGLSIRPGRPPRAITVALPRDADALDRLIKIVLGLAGIDEDARVEKIEGFRAWKLKPDAWLCRTDDAILFSNHRALLARALQVRKSGLGRLSDLKDFQSAIRAIPKDALAYAQVDLSSLRKRFGKQEGAYPAQISNPLGGFLFGGWWHAIRTGGRGVVWIRGTHQELTLGARVRGNDALPETHRGFSNLSKGRATWRAEDLPGFLSEMQASRGWARLFAEREAILTLPAAGDLVNFSNTFTTLMGGLDFVDDFLSRVNGPIRLIAARQDFSTRGYLPSPKLPAFALVIPIDFKEAAELPRRLQSASQMALSFVNADAGQKQQPTFLLDMDKYKDIRYVFAEYPRTGESPGGMMKASSKPAPQEEPDDEKKPASSENDMKSKVPDEPHYGIRHNFAPAIAVVDHDYVIATSRELLQDIIDASASKKDGSKYASEEGVADCWSISMPSLVTLLRENATELTAQRMLEQDLPKRQARRDIDAFLELLDHGKELRFESRMTERGPEASLSLTLLPPTTRRGEKKAP